MSKTWTHTRGTDKVKATPKNKEFLELVSDAEKGDVVKTDQADLELVQVFTQPGVYERRVSPTVLIRREFGVGKLFKKKGSNVLVFVPKK